MITDFGSAAVQCRRLGSCGVSEILTVNQQTLHAALRQVVRHGRVLTAAAQLAGYDADGLGYKMFRPDAVVIPASAEELIQVLKASAALAVPVTMRGAGTSLSGGPVAAQGGVVIHTSALKKIKQISRDGFWCEVECSVTLKQLDAALSLQGLFYPPDPSSGSVCTVGGNVAMNAGGAHCFRYGVTSNYVLGVEVVLLDGSVHQLGGPAGGRGDWQADWKRLMVGSEGTLGAFTRFWLRTLPRAEKAWTFRSTFQTLKSAEQAIHALVGHSSYPVAIELMDPRCVAMVENSPMAAGLPTDAFLLVTEIEGPTSLVDARVQSVALLLKQAGALQVEFSDDKVQRARLWKARKVAGGLMGQLSPDFLVQDAVIPKRALADVLQLIYDEADAAGLPVVNVFHAGDGNLHPNFMFDSQAAGELQKVEAISKRLMHRVVEVGGTLSGEHGIGNDKTAYMPLVFGPEALQMQLAVPAVFNHRHQLNPLKVFGSRRFQQSEQTAAGRMQTVSALHDASAVQPHVAGCGARLFEAFFDEIDGVVCVPASTTVSQLADQLQDHPLRFPLLIDAAAPLIDQIAACEYAPASARFGPWCDNILGVNWQLANGKVVRIGERVVKSTTGYDLLRFLLQTEFGSGTQSGRCGRPVDFVLRLRPDCDRNAIVVLHGNADRLVRAVPTLLQSCWMNWFDAVDFVVSSHNTDPSLRIAINTPACDWHLFEHMLSAFAEQQQLSMRVHFNDSAQLPAVSSQPVAGADRQAALSTMDGCPDLVLKTTVDCVVGMALQLAQQFDVRCVGLCYNAVVHVYLLPESDRSLTTTEADAAALADQIVRQFEAVCAGQGGDWRSRFASRPVRGNVEARWLEVLGGEFLQS